MKIIFMGTPEFAVPPLERLISDGHDVAAVFTQPDKPAGRGGTPRLPPVKRFAKERGIPVHQPATLKNNDEVRKVFEILAPDAAVVAAYGKILPPWLLGIPRLGCINIHSSLLPRYRGAAPVNWAIANGDTVTGVTIMQMDAGLDTGPVLARRAIFIGPEESAPELAGRLAREGADLLSRLLPRIESGEVRPVPQDDGESTLAPMLKREDGAIDWNMTAGQIAARVRAFQPWPGSYTWFRGRRLIVLNASETVAGQDGSLRGVAAEARPGTIIGLDGTGFVVACAGGTALRIEQLQVEGKRRQAARDFINGARISVGDRITDDPARIGTT